MCKGIAWAPLKSWTKSRRRLEKTTEELVVEHLQIKDQIWLLKKLMMKKVDSAGLLMAKIQPLITCLQKCRWEPGTLIEVPYYLNHRGLLSPKIIR